MTLTNDQQSAYAVFQEFMKSETQVFLLNGSAGSGKTTLLKMLIDSMKTNGASVVENWAFRLMAPTGRAAYILGKKTGFGASTIHRAIYQIDGKLSENENGKLFYKLRENNDSPNTIYFIDESSMVSDAFNDNELFGFGSGFLLRDLIQYCGKRKLVFVGDYAQLPPVGQNFSPALDAEYLKKTYNLSVIESMMRQVVRQISESGIYANAIKIRDAIEAKSYNEFYIADTSDVIQSKSLLIDYIRETECKVDENAIIIAFSNKQVLDYNVVIRNKLFPNTHRLNVGDLLIIARNNYSYKVELFNGNIVRVVCCDSDDQIEKRTVRFKTSEKDENDKAQIKEMTLCFRRIKIETQSEIQIDCLILDSFLTEGSGQISKYLSQALKTDFNNRLDKSIKRGSSEYYDLLKSDRYYNALLCKYGYAITCHKAQGGEWQKVFVDMNHFGGKSNSNYFRWAYTAITRSNKQLWHFASPEFDAISRMKVLPISTGGKTIYYAPKDESFLDWRYKKIKMLCEAQEINCEEDRSKQYQHIILFSNEDKICSVRLWCNKDSYNGKIDIIQSNNEDFTLNIKQLCDKSVIPNALPFEAHSSFAKKLHNHIIEISEELDVPILNIRQEQWKDIYYVKTLAQSALITFCYDSKSFYTNAMPQSTDGDKDKLLQRFCEQLK